MAISNAKYECFAELLHQCEMLILLKKIKACRCVFFFQNHVASAMDEIQGKSTYSMKIIIILLIRQHFEM